MFLYDEVVIHKLTRTDVDVVATVICLQVVVSVIIEILCEAVGVFRFFAVSTNEQIGVNNCVANHASIAICARFIY